MGQIETAVVAQEVAVEVAAADPPERIRTAVEAPVEVVATEDMPAEVAESKAVLAVEAVCPRPMPWP